MNKGHGNYTKALKNNLPQKCGSPDMIRIDTFPPCQSDKICNIKTGNCIQNTSDNKKGKSSVTINNRTFVGDQQNISKLKSNYVSQKLPFYKSKNPNYVYVEKKSPERQYEEMTDVPKKVPKAKSEKKPIQYEEMTEIPKKLSLSKEIPKKLPEKQKCNILSYLSTYGHAINRVTIYVYPELNPYMCLAIKNNLTRIESRCRTTADSIEYALSGGFDHFKPIKNHTLSKVAGKLLSTGMVKISIPADDDFGGHIFIIIRDGLTYYIIQSYIYEYKITISIANDEQVILYISHYLTIFSDKKWNKKDIDLWKCLTNVNLPMYRSQKPDIEFYSYKGQFSINVNCLKHIETLLDKALIKAKDDSISNTVKLLDLFGDYYDDVEKISDDVQNYIKGLIKQLSLIDNNVNYTTISDDGCLVLK